jgi:hypothetical protein
LGLKNRFPTISSTMTSCDIANVKLSRSLSKNVLIPVPLSCWNMPVYLQEKESSILPIHQCVVITYGFCNIQGEMETRTIAHSSCAAS